MNKFFLEGNSLKEAIASVNGNTAPIVSSRINMGKMDRVAIIIHVGASTAASLILQLKQSNAASAGTTKELLVDNMYFYKAGAATAFTKVSPEAKASEFDLSTIFAASAGYVVLEVLGDQLDTNNGFTHFSIAIPDTTADKTIDATFVSIDHRHGPAYSDDL